MDPEDPAINAGGRKLVCVWRRRCKRPVLHAIIGTWVPLTWAWTSRGKETMCGIEMGFAHSDRRRKWDTSVTLIENIDCADCLAAYAAHKLRGGTMGIEMVPELP